MTDIFHEIDEDLRRERLRRLWDRFGIYLIILVVAVIAGAGAFSGYRWWRQRQAQEASLTYEAAAKLADAGKHGEAEAAFEALARTGPSGYRTLALFRAAGEAAVRDPAAGVAAFDALAADPSLSATDRDLARIRAALILVDIGSPDAVKARVSAIAEGTSPLRHSARELIALSQYKAGDMAAANATAAMMLADPETPYGIRSRAELVRTLSAPAASAPTVPPHSAPAEAPKDTPAAPAGGNAATQ